MALTPEAKQAAIDKAKATVAAKKEAILAQQIQGPPVDKTILAGPAPGAKMPKASTPIKVHAKYRLYEPYLKVWFMEGADTLIGPGEKITEITSWIQSQIDARLFEIVT